MNILQLIQTVRNIVAAVQAKDYLAAFKGIMEILNTFAAQADPSIKMMGASPSEDADAKACVAELEACHVQMCAAGSDAADAKGPIIQMLIPVVLAILKAWIGI